MIDIAVSDPLNTKLEMIFILFSAINFILSGKRFIFVLAATNLWCPKTSSFLKAKPITEDKCDLFFKFRLSFIC